MGVWERSPAGLEIALRQPRARRAAIAPRCPICDRRTSSARPTACADYVVDDRFGGPEALAAAREALADRGARPDPGLRAQPRRARPSVGHDQPGCLLAGSEQDLAEHPDAFLRRRVACFAHGRDPYFPPWPDVVQLNAFSAALREAVADTLIAVGAQCDGLRCDMAMLMTNDVFARTWGERAGPPPEEDFWPALIGRVKSAHPDLLFMAEAYWDMEWTLQQQGFDLCYDKRLYDRLVHDSRRLDPRAPAGRSRPTRSG